MSMDFEERNDEMLEESTSKSIRVVMIEPGKCAYETEIGTDLSDLQMAVGGLIEPYYPFEEEVCIVCNDESKFNGMFPNRAIRDDNGEIMDVIFGPFFICDCSSEDFKSLSDEQAKRYKEMYFDPERFYMKGGKIHSEKYKLEPKREVKSRNDEAR